MVLSKPGGKINGTCLDIRKCRVWWGGQESSSFELIHIPSASHALRNVLWEQTKTAIFLGARGDTYTDFQGRRDLLRHGEMELAFQTRSSKKDG